MCVITRLRWKRIPAALLTLTLAMPLVFFAGQVRAQRQPGGDRSGPPGASAAQAAKERAKRLAEFLQRMDRDGDNRLEPNEISDRSRPFVERVARQAGMDPSRPLSLKMLRLGIREEMMAHQAASPSHPDENAAGFSEPDLTPPGFGQVENYPPIPGFGEEDDFSSATVDRADLEKAADRLRRYDTNGDGFMDREEAKRGKWSDDLFQYDKNRDHRLSQQELAMRYAVRRAGEANGQNRSTAYASRPQPGRLAQAPGKGDPRRDRPASDEGHRPDAAEREAWTLAESLMDRYDVNRDKVLDHVEWQDLGLKSATTDTDGNGLIDRRELAAWLLRRSARSVPHLPEGLPDWFARSDRNGDGQVVMSEFAEEWTEEKAAEFVAHDRNGDGVIVPEECLSGMNLPEGSYVNHQMQIIPAGTTIYSEIIVPDDDDEPIADLNVQISITHTRVELLDAFLIGPRGDRVELFTGVGGSDDHFANTIFDDEASWPIVRGRPPFAGRYQPEAVLKGEPGLSQFYGQDISGTWTLMIRADRSDRPGVLHGWSLMTSSSREPQQPDNDWQDGAPRYPPLYEKFKKEKTEKQKSKDRSRERDDRHDHRSAPATPWWLRQ